MDKAEEAKLREEERLRRAVVEEWDQTFDDDDDFYDRAGRHGALPLLSLLVFFFIKFY